MNRATLLIACLLLCGVARGQAFGLLTIREGSIYPTNVVATVEQIAEAIAAASATSAKAEAAQAAAMMVSNSVDQIIALENARNSTGYVRGFVESFSAGIEADTNMTAAIVFMDRVIDGTNVYVDLYTYFSSDPGVWPVVRTTESLLRTNAWDEAYTVNVSVTNVLVGDTLYECYLNRVQVPSEASNAFFRVQADVQGGGTNQFYFPVNNGVSVNGIAPLTATFLAGTNTIRYVGGIRVQ
jgi:hypothetical protein